MADKLMRDRIKQIVDFEAPELDVYARFTEAQLLNKDRPEDGLFIAESPKVILRALDAGYVPVSILTEERHIEGEGREVIARCRDIPVYTAGFDVLTRLTGFPLTRGMLCAMHRKPLPSPAEICRGAKRIAVTDNSVEIDDEEVCREEKLAVILGTEGDGLSPETIAACDYTVRIPMSHGVDSLNVAAASAVAFWQLGRGNRK